VEQPFGFECFAQVLIPTSHNINFESVALQRFQNLYCGVSSAKGAGNTTIGFIPIN
jgi:hypothetical protein